MASISEHAYSTPYKGPAKEGPQDNNIYPSAV